MKKILLIAIVFFVFAPSAAQASEATTQPWSPEWHTQPVDPPVDKAEVKSAESLRDSIQALKTVDAENRKPVKKTRKASKKRKSLKKSRVSKKRR